MILGESMNQWNLICIVRLNIFTRFKKVLLVYKQSFSERRSIGRRSERERKLTLISALKMESYLPIFRKKNPSKSQ